MYAHDNDDIMVPNNYVGSVIMGTTNGPVMNEDQMTWCMGIAPTSTDEITYGTSLLFMYNLNAAIYHCPADLTEIQDHPGMPRKRSYNLSNSANCSMDNHFRMCSEIRQTEELFTFIDTHEDEIFDSTFGVIPETEYFFNNYWLDVPADRHGRGANIAFADGHAEHWRWLANKFGSEFISQSYSDDDLTDLRRLQQHIKGAGGN